VAKKSCSVSAAKLEGTTVVTIEGISDGKKIHPIQQALLDAGAVQCGFCIPGIVMELYALFAKSPDASEEEMTEAISRHLCRCTGYEAIFEGAKLAKKYLKDSK
jgi:carbon-monoxide dehydrogenase small subunit